MQTFLPHADYCLSAKALDYRRLGKQRVEAKQILNALDGLSKGWVNHPATNMWRGHEGQLAVYGMAMCFEWKDRGYVDNLMPFFTERVIREQDTSTMLIPDWFGDNSVHLSHQSNLIRKDPAFYIPLFGNIPSNLPYVWKLGIGAQHANA